MRERPLTPPDAHIFPPDDLCAECEKALDEERMTDPESLEFEGFCSTQCQDTYEKRIQRRKDRR